MYVLEGKQHYDSRNFEAALENFNRAIEINRNPSDEKYFEERWKCFDRMNLREEALKDSGEILRLRGDCQDHVQLVKDLLVLKELDAAKEALSSAQAIYPESSALKDLAGKLTVAEDTHKRSQESREDYKNRELANKEEELLFQVP